MVSSDKSTITIGMVAGEHSGDQLAAGFIAEWLKKYPNTRFVGIGGPRMKALGFISLYDMDSLTALGFIEPLKKSAYLLKVYLKLKSYFTENRPHCFIGIDFKDFNLRLSAALKKKSIKTIQYVGPTIWAWRPNRVFTVKNAVDHILLLYPFEPPYYNKHQIGATYVGHPFADEIPFINDARKAKEKLKLNPNLPLLALLPGSRVSEIKGLANSFVNAGLILKEKWPELQLIAAQNESHATQCRKLFDESGGEDIPIIIDSTRDVLSACDYVLLASGTASLEAMLFKKPMVVAYKVGRITAWLFKRFFLISNIALPNILIGRKRVPEYLQEKVTPINLANELNALMSKKNNEKLLNEFNRQHKILKKGAHQTAVKAVEKLIFDEGQI